MRMVSETSARCTAVYLCFLWWFMALVPTCSEECLRSNVYTSVVSKTHSETFLEIRTIARRVNVCAHLKVFHFKSRILFS